MRKALNENPLVQVGLLAGLAVVVGFLLISRMSGGGGASTPPAETTATATATPTTSTEPSTSAPAEQSAAAVAPETVGGPESDFAAGPGLPAKVADAYDAGETVVLLIVHQKGIDDRKLEAKIDSAAAGGNSAIFTVQDKDIADYSRIAEGVDVDRVPALVVIEPKSRTEGPLPAATVSYGYRGAQSIAQAVSDALYKGRENLPYSPE